MTDAILNPIFDTLHAKNVACWGGREESAHLPPHHLASSPPGPLPPLELVFPGQVSASAGRWTGWPWVRCSLARAVLTSAHPSLGSASSGETGSSGCIRGRWNPQIPASAFASTCSPGPTNQPTKLPVFSERLFSFTAAKWRTFVCFLLQNEKGFLKRKYLNCRAEH